MAEAAGAEKDLLFRTNQPWKPVWMAFVLFIFIGLFVALGLTFGLGLPKRAQGLTTPAAQQEAIKRLALVSAGVSGVLVIPLSLCLLRSGMVTGVEIRRSGVRLLSFFGTSRPLSWSEIRLGIQAGWLSEVKGRTNTQAGYRTEEGHELVVYRKFSGKDVETIPLWYSDDELLAAVATACPQFQVVVLKNRNVQWRSKKVTQVLPQLLELDEKERAADKDEGGANQSPPETPPQPVRYRRQALVNDMGCGIVMLLAIAGSVYVWHFHGEAVASWWTQSQDGASENAATGANTISTAATSAKEWILDLIMPLPEKLPE